MAHPGLGEFVQHRVLLRADPVNIDIEIELVFVDMRAMAERRRMDRDRDWLVTRAEADAHAESLTGMLCDQLVLTLDGQTLTLIPLHDAEVDLGGMAQVGPVAFVLRLFYFARTPPSLRAGGELVLTDRLWPTAPALCTLNVKGDAGIKLRATVGSVCSAGAGPARLLRATCVSSPNRPAQLLRTPDIQVANQNPHWSAPRWPIASLLAGLVLWGTTRRRPRHRT